MYSKTKIWERLKLLISELLNTIGFNSAANKGNTEKLSTQANKLRAARLYRVEHIADCLQQQIPVITPNQRLASRVLSAWNDYQSSSGLISWRTADICSIEHWFSLQWQRYLFGSGRRYAGTRVLNAQIANQLWQRCIRQSPQGELLLKVSATAQQAASAYKTIKLWRLDTSSPEIKQRFTIDEDCAEFLGWFDSFEQICEQEAFITPEQCIELMLNDSDSLHLSSLVLLEFEDIPPLYRDFFEARVSQLQEYRDRERKAQCKALASDDDEDEIYGAAHWIKTILEQDSTASIGFIYPQLAQQRRRIERIFNEVLNPSVIAVDENRCTSPFNFSAGTELGQCAPIKVALNFLSLLLPEIEIETAIVCLSSRYGESDSDELNGRARIIKALHDQGLGSISNSSFRYILQSCSWSDREGEQLKGIALGEQLSTLSQNRRLRSDALPSAWAELTNEALATMGWPGAAALDSAEYQQIEHWYRVLEEIELQDEISAKISYTQFLSLLQQLLAETVFQAKTPDSPIQILGQLEGAGLQFSHLWIAGMGHLDWPPTANPNPFIPISIQRSMSMPHADAERELHFCSQLLDSYRHSADHLCFSFVGAREGIQQKLSGLLSDVAVISKEELYGCVPEMPYLRHWRSFNENMVFSEVNDTQGPALSAEEQARGGSGLLEDQSACAFRAFAKHRLGAEALKELQPALTAMERGILLHEALFRLWSEVLNSDQLMAMDDQQLVQVIGDAVESAVGDFLKKSNFQYGEQYLSIEKSRLQALLAEWMNLERQRDQFTVIAQEQAKQFELGPLKISLRIDRIDELEDGSKLLIDYKSGNCDIKHWFGDRPEKPQLPLYAAVEGAEEAEVGGIAYAQVKKQKTAYIGLSANNSFGAVLICNDQKALQKKKLDWQGNWPQLMENWQGQINQLAQEFIEGLAIVKPARGEQTCRYCDLACLCRKHEILQ